MTKTSTFFGLLAEFNSAEIPLSACCSKYFGCSERQAKERAAASSLPVPAYRAGSQKSEWLINASDLAEHIDRRRELANERWKIHNMEAA